MKNVVIIPAEATPRELKKKSFKFLFKTPLILDYAKQKKASLKNTYMFRPRSDDIKKLCEKMKVHFIRRPKNLCSDTSSSESAILHSLKAMK